MSYLVSNTNTKMKTFLSILLLCFFVFETFAQNDTIRAQEFYDKGKELHYDGKYVKAYKPFEKALKAYQNLYGEDHEKVMYTYFWIGENAMRIRDHQKALEYLNKALVVGKKIKEEDDDDMIDLYLFFGHTYTQMFEISKSNYYYNKCLELNRKKFGEESSEVGNIYMSFAMNNYKMGMYSDAQKNNDKAYEIFLKSSEPTSKDMYRVYLTQANIANYVGNYEKAIEACNKSLEIKLTHYDESHESVAKYYSVLSMAYQGKNDYETALKYELKGLNIISNALGKNDKRTGWSYIYLADIYFAMGDFDKGKKYFDKALKIYERTMEPSHPYLMSVYLDKGNYLVDEGKYDEALDIFNTVLQKLFTREYIARERVSYSYYDIANVHLLKKEYDVALKNVNNGFEYVSDTYTNKENDIYKNPNDDEVQDIPNLIDLLVLKSSILQKKFNKEENIKDLEQAFIASELTIKSIEKLRKSFQSEASRNLLNTSNTSIYKNAVNQAYKLYELTDDRAYLFKAFSISDKSKSSILWQNIYNNYALEASDIPTNELEKLTNISSQISVLEASIELEDNQSLRREIYDYKKSYQEQIQKLEQYNPAYYQLKYAIPDFDINEIKNKLSHQEALIHYFYDDEFLYSFVLTTDGLSSTKTKIEFDLNESILSIRNSNLNKSILKKSKNEKYLAQLNKLHQLLIQPIESNIQSKEDLIIIPYGVLNYLSFDILSPTESSQDFRKLDYLIKDYAIHYAWSVNLWNNPLQSASKTSYDYAGFAPVAGYNKLIASNETAVIYRDDLSELANSEEEIEHANRLFEGEIFINDQATESQFKQLANQSNILHLATHALVSDKFPLESGLLFSTGRDTLEDGYLKAYEIYNIKMNADLAVMSACNTGYGQLSEGEGVMSLGRAFLYAGCKSIVMSLWLANDLSSKNIMQEFYEQLSLGKTKNEALRQAKLTYLDNADVLTAHPYFWANLVAVGDMNSLKADESNRMIYFLLGGFGMLLLFFGWKQFSN